MVRVVNWSRLANDTTYHTDIGYSLKKCERWWLVVRIGESGTEIWCGSYWLVNSLLDDNTLLYDYQSATKVANDIGGLPLNLSDFWRIGDTVNRKLQHPSSQAIADKLAQKT